MNSKRISGEAKRDLKLKRLANKRRKAVKERRQAKELQYKRDHEVVAGKLYKMISCKVV